MALVLSGDGSITGNPNITLTENVSIAGTVTYEDVTNVDSIGIITARSGINITGGSLDVQGNTTITGTLVASNGNITSEVDLTGISSSISDTAVDVFVYDTSKDSDGGEWRKRTSHTSWYNETLNTSTRGSRKDFPAVAVIVAETTKVTIYDGDDPDLPMWMVFETNSQDMLVGSGINAVAMLNGILSVARNTPIIMVNFVADKSNNISPGSETNYVGNIKQRNDALGFTTNIGPRRAVANVGNDVAMTVLPNAPIDDTTGLPIPTIAVTTDGGLSIIKDDGTVANNSRGVNETYSLAFDVDNSLIFSWGTSDDFPRHITRLLSNVWSVTSSNTSLWPNNYFSGYNEGLGNAAGSTGGASGGVVTVANSGRHFGIEYGTGGNTDDRLGILHPKNLTNYTDQNLSAFITSSYNTGYMHGDIKGAFLSDTDTTNAIEYVQNGYFNSNVNNWTIGTTGTTATLDSNRMLITAPTSGTSWGYVYQGITTEIGKTYKISLYYDRGTVDGRLNVRNDSTSTVAGSLFYADLGTGNDSKTYYNTFTATATTTYILLYSKNASGGTNAYDQISVTLEKDRSVNNKGLQVFGTVTKTAVATGADLVGYSNFSGSNFLKQPYNSDLAPGTGQYSVMFWVNTTYNASNDQYLFDRAGSSSRILMTLMQNDSKIQFYVVGSGGAASNLVTNDIGISENVWHQVVGLYDGSLHKVYIDGVESSNTTTGQDVGNDGTPALHIGVRHSEATSTQQLLGNLALFRWSKSAPTAEQVKKMYEDEKFLFQENAQATLYGSSNLPTALVYDEVTDQIHVGTSSGRSDFQGLRRINNTTTAVTTAISAHDTFIIEQ